jgi:hypothetical protein
MRACFPASPVALKDAELPAGMGFAHCIKTRVAIHSPAAVVGRISKVSGMEFP